MISKAFENFKKDGDGIGILALAERRKSLTPIVREDPAWAVEGEAATSRGRPSENLIREANN